ncbi:MAG: biopolymer transporter ExbD [Rickettsiales bacterium]|nr:biopolymer transporter ExbD [Rickettsiales bacterium]
MAFGGFNQNQNSSPMSEINTTPLVDVMLVLLIIFMVTAPLITNTVNVNLPNSKTVASPEKPNVVNVSLDVQGNLTFNGKPISDADLPQLLQNEVAKKKDTELRLQADRDTRYQKITDIMTEANKAGISKLGFVSKVEK